MRLLPRHTCDHRLRWFLEHSVTTIRTISRSTRSLLLALRNYFPAESKPFVETIYAAEGGGSARRMSQLMLELQRSSWLDWQAASRFHLQQLHDAHAMSIRPQSCNLYPEEKRSACLGGSTRPFFAQRFTGPLDRIRRKSRSIFRWNSHKQSPLPFELDR